MARTQQVKIKKGNAHTTEYENNTPAGCRGFIFAYEIRRNTSSHLRFLSVTYVYVRSRQEIRTLLVLLVFPNGKAAQYFVALTFSKAQKPRKKGFVFTKTPHPCTR